MPPPNRRRSSPGPTPYTPIPSCVEANRKPTEVSTRSAIATEQSKPRPTHPGNWGEKKGNAPIGGFLHLLGGEEEGVLLPAVERRRHEDLARSPDRNRKPREIEIEIEIGFALLRLVARWGSGEPGFPPLLSARFCSSLFSTCAGLVGMVGWWLPIIVAFTFAGVGRRRAGARAWECRAGNVAILFLHCRLCGVGCHC